MSHNFCQLTASSRPCCFHTKVPTAETLSIYFFRLRRRLTQHHRQQFPTWFCQQTLSWGTLSKSYCAVTRWHSECHHGRTSKCPHGRTSECPHGCTSECPHGRTSECPHGRTSECLHGRTSECPHGRTSAAGHHHSTVQIQA